MNAATASEAVCFLGLSDVAQIRDGEASFPLGILYPYTGDLRRVCSAYEALSRESANGSPQFVGDTTPAGATLLESIAALHRRIAFAPGSAGANVAAAYRQAEGPVRATPARRG